ncbi:MAG: cell wall hydrolase [Paracoccaceae bacterium]|jgi:spore germination cell wall hydrolase CwlJ-like protein
MCDGKAEYIGEPLAFSQSAKIAKIMLNGAPRELTKGALFYHAKSVSPRWIKKMHRTATIGYHHFYVAKK